VCIAHADCRDVLPLLSDVSCVVTDPPYELGFMGKDWDKSGISFDPHTWKLVAAACKPGAMMLSFGGTRTWHRMVCAIEDGGWEIRDTLMWLYGSGFPKSLDISKAIDKGEGVWRGRCGAVTISSQPSKGREYERTDKGMPLSDAAKEWQGYGTALKPAWEPICLAMKPLESTFAHNALTYGVAGLNIDGSRINPGSYVPGGGSCWGKSQNTNEGWKRPAHEHYTNPQPHTQGRWPANLILDEEAARMLDEQSGERPGSHDQAVYAVRHDSIFKSATQYNGIGKNDSGGASRFFYTAKASRGERDPLCEELLKNDHATVKPLSLMVYLVKLLAPPKNATILDPFMGSGTTGLACQKLGVRFIGIDNNERNVEIAARRMSQSVMQL
jgi:DNA modification methylase